MKDLPSEYLTCQCYNRNTNYYANSQPYENHKTLTECNPFCLLLVPNVVLNNKITDWCCSTHIIGHLATIYKTVLLTPPHPTKKIFHHHLHLPSFTLRVHLSQLPGLKTISCLPHQTYPYSICEGNITSGCRFLQILQLSHASINARMLCAHSLIQNWHNITLATDSIIK